MKTDIRAPRVLIIVLSVVLLIASTFALLASATDSEEGHYSIIAKNVIFGEKTHIVFAVNTEIENADNIKVAYFYENSPEKIYHAEYYPDFPYTDKNGTEDTSDDVRCPAYITHGFAPNNYTDKIYAVAYVGDSIPTSGHTEYSIAEYLYSKLYRDGYVAKTDKRAALYKSMLEFSGNAQEVLDNDPINNPFYDENNPETLITEYRIVYTSLDGATVNGKDKSTLVKFGESVKLLAPEADSEGLPFDSWQLYDAEKGNLIKVVENGEAFTVTAHIKAVAQYKEKISVGRGSGKYADNQFTNTFDNGVDNIIGSDSSVYDCSIDNNMAATIFAEDNSQAYGFNVSLDGLQDEASIVVEFDFMVESAEFDSRNDGFRFRFGNDIEKVGAFNGVYLSLNKNDGKIILKDNNSNIAITSLTLGSWYTIRLVIHGTDSGSAYDVYVNGEIVYSSFLNDNLSAASVFSFTTFSKSNFIGTIYFDNIFASIN